MLLAKDTQSARIFIPTLIVLTGLASLSWEVLWQIKSSLALGVSAWGTAVTLAVTMGGMCAGSLLSGHILKEKKFLHPVRIYAVLESIVGISGLFLSSAFRLVENADTWTYARMPQEGSFVHVIGIIAVLGVPTMCMGATLPVFGLLARSCKMSLAVLYGLNTLGAAAGTLLAAFFLIPQFGITLTGSVIAALNFFVAGCAWILGSFEMLSAARVEKGKTRSLLTPTNEHLVVLVTGFATFVLEVAWFRSLTAAFRSTTDAFAIMLAAILVGLGAAARLVPLLKKMKIPLGSILCWAGFLILVATPFVERFDRFPPLMVAPIYLVMIWFLMSLITIGSPILFLGAGFPWILDDQQSTRRWGRLYALNTLAAIVGSLGAAWLFLPTIGFAQTAWMAGALVGLAGLIIAPTRLRLPWGALCASGLFIAMLFDSGAGRTIVQGRITYGTVTVKKILDTYEGPEATISAVEYSTGGRALIIDGFMAASQIGDNLLRDHYMAWMGHLPMLLNPNPKDALVICFGTGQTANAVRRENPETLDIVDINPRVFKLAHNFDANENVLGDPRVHSIVMDGRAYLRRTTKMYDIITLEPMPPNFAGVNALYSKEFYQLARKRLRSGGLIAQWLPFHLVSAHYSASIARTLQSVFPNAVLWIDPSSQTGILLGSKDDEGDLGKVWPGFERTPIKRELTKTEVKKALFLDRHEMERYGAKGELITDDNQLLAYGAAVVTTLQAETPKNGNFELLESLKKPGN